MIGVNRSKEDERFLAYWRSFLKEVDLTSLTYLGKSYQRYSSNWNWDYKRYFNIQLKSDKALYNFIMIIWNIYMFYRTFIITLILCCFFINSIEKDENRTRTSHIIMNEGQFEGFRWNENDNIFEKASFKLFQWLK